MFPFYVKRKWNTLWDNRGFLLIFGSVYFLGVIFGLFFRKKAEFNPLCAPVCEYYFKLFCRENNSFVMLIRYTAINFVLCVVFLALGFSLYTVPLQGLILLYRGMILGNVVPVLFSVFGFSSVVIIVIVTIPYQILSSAGNVVIGVLNIVYLKSLHYCKRMNKSVLVQNALCGFVVCFAACLYQFLVLAILIRPLSIYL